MDLTFVITATVVFSSVILLLVILLSFISNRLSPGGTVTLDINDGKKQVDIEPGQSLLAALAGARVGRALVHPL